MPAHAPHDGHSHHDSHSSADGRSLTVALVLIVAFLVVETAVALTTGSVALLADAAHMLSDAGALAGALWALRLATRPASGAWTFGWKRAEILSAAVNGTTLLVLGVVLLVEAVQHLLHPPPVGGWPLLATALAGVGVNVVATLVLSRADRGSLNVEGAFQHILTDLYAFAATAVAGVVILLTGFTRADGIASLVVVALMLRSAWGLLRDSGRVLLEVAPVSVDLAELRAHLLETDHVLDVHDLHAWTVTSGLPALTAHVVVTDSCFEDGHAPQILDALQSCLVGHFDVEHSTFQLEPAGHGAHEVGAHH